MNPGITIKNGDVKVLTKVQKYQLIESMLNESFPLIAIWTSVTFDVFLAIASIGFQIASIVLKTELYFIACGIWVGCFVLITETITMLLIFRRTYKLYIYSIIFQILSFLISIAQIVIYAIAVAVFCCASINWLTYVLLSLGVLYKLPSIIFFAVFLYKSTNYLKNFDADNYYMHN